MGKGGARHRGFIYPWGDEWDPKRCNHKFSGPMPVDAYPDDASPYGVLDVAGNVREWCSTLWEAKAYPVQAQAEWTEEYLKSTDIRVQRGSPWWLSFEYSFRCAFRLGSYPLIVNDGNGWRVAASLL